VVSIVKDLLSRREYERSRSVAIRQAGREYVNRSSPPQQNQLAIKLCSTYVVVSILDAHTEQASQPEAGFFNHPHAVMA
jgi:metal-responsive CopG/Arc/MetJ family transcriptional regulator